MFQRKENYLLLKIIQNIPSSPKYYPPQIPNPKPGLPEGTALERSNLYFILRTHKTTVQTLRLTKNNARIDVKAEIINLYIIYRFNKQPITMEENMYWKVPRWDESRPVIFKRKYQIRLHVLSYKEI